MSVRLPHIGTISALAAGLAGLVFALVAVRSTQSFAAHAARAEAAIAAAAREGALWLHTREKLVAAGGAYARGETARAGELAAAAEAEAALAIEQRRLETARYRLRRDRELGTPLDPQAVRDLEAALSRRDGRGADEAARHLEPRQ